MNKIKKYTYDWKPNFKYHNFISVISPYTNKAVFEVPSLGKEDIKKIYYKSYQSFLKWKKTTGFFRIELLNKWIKELELLKSEIINAIHWEVGKSLSECEMEFKKGINVIRSVINEYQRLTLEAYHPVAIKRPREELAFFERQPVGVVLAISPFNYPFNLAINKLAPCLIMGNTVVFKPSTNGSVVGILIVKALFQAGFTDDQVQIVTGKGSEIGSYLFASDKIKFIHYTGSTETGDYISSHSRNCSLLFEMGGKDPAIVLDDCDLKLTASEIIKGAFSFNGQRCTAIKRVLITKETASKLIPYLKTEIEKLKVSKNPNVSADITPIITIKNAEFVKELINEAISKGAKVIIGNKFEENLIYPTLLDNVPLDAKLASVEQFAPVLPIIYYKTIKEAIEIANDVKYGLQGCIFSKDYPTAYQIAKQIDTGRIHINFAPERGMDIYPFTGSKLSGIGTQSLYWSLIQCSYLKGTIFSV